MSIESIIGIVSGIVGIVAATCSVISWLSKHHKEYPTIELFTQVTNKDLSDADHRKFLEKLNKSKLINNRIKKEYIQNFVLSKRGKEEVLLDICNSNNIEPTEDICKGLLDYSSSTIKAKFDKNRTSNLSVTVSASDKNEICAFLKAKGEQMVYMSELLNIRYPETCKRLTDILDKHNVKYAFLKGTKDIWCRDYMPVQTESGKLIQFKYAPSYLKGNKEWEDSRSDVEEVCRTNNINAQSSNINLDGGNVLICDDRAIITDRIFSENPDWNNECLITELGKLLECEIIIIPALRSKDEDFTGHADGMVRFVDRNTILGNRLSDEYKYIQEGMQKVMEKFNLRYIDIPFFVTKDPEHPYSAIGIYVNYLEVNNLIVLPVFGREEDKQAVEIMQKTFPERVIETIDYNDVAQEGGLLNCTTWIVRTSVDCSIDNK